MRNLMKPLLLCLGLLLALQVQASTRVLYAGKNQPIGEVETYFMGNELVVTAQVTEVGWCLSASHLYVGEQAPTTSAPGQFPFQHELGCSLSDTYRVNVAAADQYVAYHAVSKQSAHPIGGTVSYMVQFPGDDSYLKAYIDGMGPYDAWCIDIGRSITPGTTYTNCELRSLNDQDLGVVDREENLGYAGWILNQDWSLYPEYSWKEIQAALWKLIDDNPPQNAAGGISWDEAKALEIVNMALQNGVGYTAASFEGLVVLCKNTNGVVNRQITLVAVPVAGFFIGEDTAWAQGSSNWYNSKGNMIGWGSYFLEPYSQP
ncbi:hypothetical protein KJI95_11155 [Shewanella sp. JM162201]|uniref:Uncharacterized protein n=1 Tax=Shewanella jiangmenensis TaxID=2837387 RepID=A0ABS5V3P9_9GAMM|nr:hypothetical protein [Shewanella jiangmenensis]MBT1445077.1 hypothetical protein [Shewanella jiangmenensis]